MAATVLDVLKNAKFLIEKGWTQGTFVRADYDEFGNLVGTVQYCAVGAVRAATRALVGEQWRQYDDLQYGARQCLEKALFEHDSRPHDIIAFNDSGGRTKEEVVVVFDKAIAEGCA